MAPAVRIPPALAKRIEDEIAALVPEPVGHISYEAIRYQALPLFGTLGAVWLLRSDGSLWTVDSDSGAPFEPLAEGWHTIALVAGTGRYPWLGELLPTRPVSAVSCGDCGGSGRIGHQRLFCHSCSALG